MYLRLWLDVSISLDDVLNAAPDIVAQLEPDPVEDVDLVAEGSARHLHVVDGGRLALHIRVEKDLDWGKKKKRKIRPQSMNTRSFL